MARGTSANKRRTAHTPGSPPPEEGGQSHIPRHRARPAPGRGRSSALPEGATPGRRPSAQKVAKADGRASSAGKRADQEKGHATEFGPMKQGGGRGKLIRVAVETGDARQCSSANNGTRLKIFWQQGTGDAPRRPIPHRRMVCSARHKPGAIPGEGMAIGCAKTRNQTRARECWFPVPIVAPVGPPVKFLQHFRDRQKAQVQRGFCASSLGFGNATNGRIALRTGCPIYSTSYLPPGFQSCNRAALGES